jgi:hypothetical protein
MYAQDSQERKEHSGRICEVLEKAFSTEESDIENVKKDVKRIEGKLDQIISLLSKK